MIFLIGMPASGKTTVGKQLARMIGGQLVDLDRVVEKAAKRSISRIFHEEHEWGFRVREAHALLELMKQPKRNLVVATGGGAPAFGENMHVMTAHGGTVIYLRAKLTTLAKRPGLLKRPILASHPKGPAAGLRALFRARGPIYQQAQLIIDVDGQTPAGIAHALAHALEDVGAAELHGHSHK